MTDLMKAVVYLGPEELKIKTMNVPKISEDEILVKVKASGVCGTDIRIYHSLFRIPIEAGRIIGHEFAGDIVKVGGKVKDLQEGMRVTVRPIIHCGKCIYCMQERTNLCVTRPTLGYDYDGAFAEYVKIPAQAIKIGNVFEIPPALSYEEAAITEPLAACINGIERSNINAGDTVIIFGAGPLGLMHLQLTKLYNAQVIVSEVAEKRLKIAKDLGADLVVNPKNEDLCSLIKDLRGYEADVAIVATGSPIAIELAMKSVKKGGTINLFGGSPAGSTITLDPNIIHYGELLVTGTSGFRTFHHWKAIKLVSKGQIKLKPLITHTLPLEEAVKAILMKEKGEGLKHILIP